MAYPWQPPPMYSQQPPLWSAPPNRCAPPPAPHFDPAADAITPMGKFDWRACASGNVVPCLTAPMGGPAATVGAAAVLVKMGVDTAVGKAQHK